MDPDLARVHHHTVGHECEHGVTTVRRFAHSHERGHDPHGHESLAADKATYMHQGDAERHEGTCTTRRS